MEVFGISSSLLLLPFIYSLNPVNKFTVWKLLLFLLPISSFLCNHFVNHSQFQACDHTIIIALCIVYFLHFKKYNVPVLIVILYLVEMMLVKSTEITVILAFIALNLFAFTNFTKIELVIGMIAFSIAIVAKLSRDNYAKTYPLYTTIWHICCAILLILATRSVER